MHGQLLIFAGSLAGIALMVLAALALRLGQGAAIADEAEARELADDAICGFAPCAVALDASGRGALLCDGEGRILLLSPHGAHFAASLLDAGAHAERAGSQLTVAGTRLDLGHEAEIWEIRVNALNS